MTDMSQRPKCLSKKNHWVYVNKKFACVLRVTILKKALRGLGRYVYTGGFADYCFAC